MTMVLGCIADDFTGATDLAGLLARSGAPVSLRIGVPTDPPQDTAAFEVIALKCRTSPVEEAIAETQAAYRWLKAAGAGRFFWKYCSTFDSRAEGNIGPVAEALMAEIGTDQTIYCPAFPENGRSIFMGNLFVGEQPLAESPMKDHPLTPMRDSNLMRLLTPQVRAQTLILSGSCSAMTNRQVAEYRATDAPSYRLDPLVLVDSGAAPVLDWLAAQDLAAAPLIYATADPASVRAAQERLGTEAAGKLVEDVLATCAVAARDAGGRRFIVAGGETSGAVTKALDVDTLAIGREIAPGVPWTYCTSGGHALALTLKSGNFGGEAFFSDAMALLETA